MFQKQVQFAFSAFKELTDSALFYHYKEILHLSADQTMEPKASVAYAFS